MSIFPSSESCVDSFEAIFRDERLSILLVFFKFYLAIRKTIQFKFTFVTKLLEFLFFLSWNSKITIHVNRK